MQIAKEFILNSKPGNNDEWISFKEVENLLIKFAKLHVEAALKEANERVKIEHRDYKNNKFIPYGQEVSSDMENCYWGVNTDSILNAYPLTNIK